MSESVVDKVVQQGPAFNPSANYEIERAVFDVDNTIVGNESSEGPHYAFLTQAKRAASAMQLGIQSARGANKTLDSIIGPLVRTAGVDVARWHGLANGAQIFDAKEGEMRVESTVPTDVAMDFARYFTAHNISFWINDAKKLECADFFPVAPKAKGETLGTFARQKNIWLPASSDNLTIIEDYVPHRPLVVVADDVPGDKYADLIDFAAGFRNDNVRPLLYAHNQEQDTYKVFFLHKEANKRSALETISILSHVTLEHTATFGDGRNDDDMLRASIEAGGLGFAMGNAHPSLKEIATHILPRQEQHGAAIGLRYVLDHYASK